MGDLANVIGAPEPVGLAGFTLFPPTLLEVGIAERAIEVEHVRLVTEAVREAPCDVQAKLITIAVDEVKAGAFGYGRPAFSAAARKAQHYPLLRWLCVNVGYYVTRNEFEERAAKEPGDEAA